MPATVTSLSVHTLPNTYAEVVLTPTLFQTLNVGPPLPFPLKQLFERFVKNPARAESTGLGLALVRQIAERGGMAVQYAYDEQTHLHTFTVYFSGQASAQVTSGTPKK